MKLFLLIIAIIAIISATFFLYKWMVAVEDVLIDLQNQYQDILEYLRSKKYPL